MGIISQEEMETLRADCFNRVEVAADAADLEEHPVKEVRLIVENDLPIGEDGEQLVRRESRIDRFIGGARTAPDIRDAELSRRVQRA